jgi:two-component system sensor histidine kinase BaeS
VNTLLDVINVSKQFRLGEGATTLGSAAAGAGVAPIFDRFHKSEHSRGTGLGLPIARSLVRAHGGEISAASVPSKGTAVRVTLPVHSSP